MVDDQGFAAGREGWVLRRPHSTLGCAPAVRGGSHLSMLTAGRPAACVPQAASERKKEGSSALDEFCRDLCAEAQAQRTDPVRAGGGHCLGMTARWAMRTGGACVFAFKEAGT